MRKAYESLCLSFQQANAANVQTVPIKRVVVAIEDLDENQTILSSIIGFEKDGYLVSSDDSTLEGQMLTTDNIASCTLEIPDEE